MVLQETVWTSIVFVPEGPAALTDGLVDACLERLLEKAATLAGVDGSERHSPGERPGDLRAAAERAGETVDDRRGDQLAERRAHVGGEDSRPSFAPPELADVSADRSSLATSLPREHDLDSGGRRRGFGGLSLLAPSSDESSCGVLSGAVDGPSGATFQRVDAFREASSRPPVAKASTESVAPRSNVTEVETVETVERKGSAPASTVVGELESRSRPAAAQEPMPAALDPSRSRSGRRPVRHSSTLPDSGDAGATRPPIDGPWGPLELPMSPTRSAAFDSIRRPRTGGRTAGGIELPTIAIADGPAAESCQARMPDLATGCAGDPFALSELEEQIADVLERAATEAGVDLS